MLFLKRAEVPNERAEIHLARSSFFTDLPALWAIIENVPRIGSEFLRRASTAKKY